jgi:transcription elongation factor GreA
MLEKIREKLMAEVDTLNHELNVILPEALRKAIALGDLKENADYHAAKERQDQVTIRLNQLRVRLSQLSMVDLTKIPSDRVGLGSTVVVQDLATKEKQTYELVIADIMDLDGTQISMGSPLGIGLVDCKIGDTTEVFLPAGERRLKVLKLKTFHDQEND